MNVIMVIQEVVTDGFSQIPQTCVVIGVDVPKHSEDEEIIFTSE